MNTLQVNEALEGYSFEHNKKRYAFKGCKQVNSNIMIFTDKETLQISLEKMDDFYDNALGSMRPLAELSVKDEFKPRDIHLKNGVAIMPETPKSFEKLNTAFDALIDEINSATDETIKTIEAKAKMLTSVAQTTVNMETTKINLIKLFNGK